MRWTSLVVCLILLRTPAHPQAVGPSSEAEKNIIRVGVAEPYNQSPAVFQPSWERDQLVRYLNREAQRKKPETAIEALALNGSSMTEVAAEAKQKHCQFVVLTTATGTNTGVTIDSRNGIGRVPGTVGTGGRDPDLLINYHIQRANDERPAARGSVIAHGSNYQGQPTQDWNEAVRQAMADAAPRVLVDIRRLPVPQPD